ncbi:MAG: hypothetical protein A2X46_08925 [Lentisphaerae bacterium GWF2_57_35]|nr:MAG: hypothetical protein A2X46_08925 [Lentisphaerae bacterium GWF2_57_35]
MLALILFCNALAQSVEPTRFEIYPVPFADLNAAEESVRALVGKDDSVVVDARNRRLLVVTTAERHARVAEWMNKLNVVPCNVRIDVEFRGASHERSQGVSVNAAVEVDRQESLSGTTFKVKPRIRNETVSLSSRVSQSLLVASGREGRIEVGERVPYLEWIEDWGLRHGLLQQRLNWQRVGASLVVEPLVVGEGPTVRVRLTPELSGLVDGNPYRLRFARVSTEVVVTDGMTFQIGGMDKDREFFSRFLVGADNNGVQQTMDIYLTPHIVHPVPR